MARDSHDNFQPDELVILLDGDEVHPQSLDAAAALDFVGAVVGLLEKLGKRTARPVHFGGLRVLDKCAAFAFVSEDISTGSVLLEETLQLISGKVEPPAKLKNATARAQRALRALPDHYECTGGVGQARSRFQAPPQTRRRLTTSLETFRAVPQRVGSARGTTARFTDPLSKEKFVLHSSGQLLQELVYGREVEVEAKLVRDEEGLFVRGELIQVMPLDDSEGSDFTQWRSWFQENASEWNDVTDIEAELSTISSSRRLGRRSVEFA